MAAIRKFPSESGEITHLTLTNASGASVVLSTVGAGIVEVNVPDSKGRLADVTLGYADPTAYIGDGPNVQSCKNLYGRAGTYGLPTCVNGRI